MKTLDKIIVFVIKQFEGLVKGGRAVVWWKLKFLLLLPLAIPIVLIIRLICPIVKIRFRPLNSPRIGHFAANTEMYLCERDVGFHGKGSVDIFYNLPGICNNFLKKKWDDKLHVIPAAMAADRVNRLIPGGNSHIVPMPLDIDMQGLMARIPPHLCLTEDEKRRGWVFLESLGVPAQSQFICFFSRDSAYLDKIAPDAQYYRYQDFRDSSIYDCIPAIEELTGYGYYAFRMGAIVKDRLLTTNPKIIDYGTKHRSDFLDIFLGSQCKFFLGSSAGIIYVPRIFRRPIVNINFIPLDIRHFFTCLPNTIVIPKKLWLKSEKRFLSFSEIANGYAGDFSIKTQQYKSLGLEIIDNNPEEILAAAMEMNDRLENRWNNNEHDEILQQRFWDIFKLPEVAAAVGSRIEIERDIGLKVSHPWATEDEELQEYVDEFFDTHPPTSQFLPRIGAEFLRQHQKLLE